MEDFGGVAGFEDLREVLAVGVGDEDLTELLSLYHIDDTFYAFGVEAVEDVVEEQDWFTYVQSLCQFHREDESTLLSLGTDLLQRVVSETHFEVIFVDALRGPAENEVALACPHIGIAQVAVLELGDVT